jgi:hypothetical protein
MRVSVMSRTGFPGGLEAMVLAVREEALRRRGPSRRTGSRGGLEARVLAVREEALRGRGPSSKYPPELLARGARVVI